MTQDVTVIRASSLSDLFDCPHRFEAKQLLGMRGKNSAPALLGTAIHAATAVYDTAKMLGGDASISEATDTFVDALKSDDSVDWRYADITYKTAELIGLKLTDKYCRQVSPLFNYVGVEMETKPFDIVVEKTVIRLTGTMDRARASIGTGGGVGISDVKSGRRSVDKDTRQAVTKGHAPQIGIYELLYEHTTGALVTEPAMIIGMQTTTDATIGTGIIYDARKQLVGDAENKGLLEYAAMYIKAGMYPPNPKSSLCSDKYCPRFHKCKFKD
jgi:hypothetical protein